MEVIDPTHLSCIFYPWSYNDMDSDDPYHDTRYIYGWYQGGSYTVNDLFIQQRHTTDFNFVCHGKLPASIVLGSREALPFALWGYTILFNVDNPVRLLNRTYKNQTFPSTQEYTRVRGEYTYRVQVIGNRNGSNDPSDWTVSANTIIRYKFNRIDYYELKQVNLDLTAAWDVESINSMIAFAISYCDMATEPSRTGVFKCSYIVNLKPLNKQIPIIPTAGLRFGEAQIGENWSPAGNWVADWLMQHAFLDAASSAGVICDNQIANMISLCSTIISLKNGKVRLPQNWQDTWLSYRYSFTTSVADAEQALLYLKRHVFDLKDTYTSYGISFRDGVTCRCTLKMSQRENVSAVQNLWREAYKMGLQPNPYVLWDMVPFSFVADWFTPIGDVAEAISKGSMCTTAYNNYSRIGYSLSYSATIGPSPGIPIEYYTRWAEKSVPKVEGCYWFDDGDKTTSTKTILKRAADSAAFATTIKL